MRFLYTTLIAISVGILQYIDNPSIFQRAWAAVSLRGNEAIQQKDVRIEGLKVLPRAEVERVLPYDKSVLWWHINGTDVQSKVEENPWIEEASLESCPGGALRNWGCFVLLIKERSPKFIGLVDNERWIIDSDGVFIMPSGGPLYGLSPQVAERLVLVEGLASRSSSPDLLKSQLALAAVSITTLEKTVGRESRALRFEQRGDFSVIFEGLPFPVIFDGASDSPVSLSEQAERLVSLLAKLKDRFGEVAKVDLAFARVGVVKFRADEAPPKAEQGAQPGSDRKAAKQG